MLLKKPLGVVTSEEMSLAMYVQLQIMLERVSWILMQHRILQWRQSS